MNGAGSVGTVIEGPIIGLVAQRWGWMGVLLLMVVLSALGAVALLRAAVSDGLSRRANNDEDESTSWPV